MTLPKEQTGLSESQQEILQLFAQDVSDTVIAQRLGISSSTVRNHRFKLKKQRQATVFKHHVLVARYPVAASQRATMLDDRYAITASERERSLLLILMKRGLSNSFPAKKSARSLS